MQCVEYMTLAHFGGGMHGNRKTWTDIMICSCSIARQNEDRPMITERDDTYTADYDVDSKSMDAVSRVTSCIFHKNGQLSRLVRLSQYHTKTSTRRLTHLVMT